MQAPNTEMVVPSALLPNPWNPNVVDPINQEKLQNSLDQDRQKMPVIVRETDEGLEILDGQHRVQAATALGWEEIWIRNMGRLSDAEAKKITLIGNSRYGEDDRTLMAELLGSDIEDAASLLATLPIDEQEMAEFFEHETMDLSALEDDLDLDPDADVALGLDLPDAKPAQTHQILRFKVTVEDAAELSERITQAKASQGFTAGDDLTNAGDALVHLLLGDTGE